MFFRKLKETLAATTKALTGRIKAIVKGRKIEPALWDEVEEALLTADVGVEATTELLDGARNAAKLGEILSGDDLIPWLRRAIAARLAPDERTLRRASSGPTVVLIAGVNGCGKTTSIAKLCRHLRSERKSVMLAACDTFRAAAVEQLGIWAERLGVEFVRGPAGSDPASVAFDAADRAARAGTDFLIVDTAGRLHTQKNLMEELGKITRVLGKRLPGAPHETLLVLDGTAGQNGLAQTKRFREHAQVTGLIVTKLDGTAKGGVVLSIRDQLRVPVKFIGTGESPEDFAPFDEEAFTAALFGEERE